ncbi:hypothetical protein [Thalassovita sp.]|uniref:hypothetical protein n=1 Tax=Thalassovita sp. TaxID=1979401 RepID=UPI002880D31F|nr:hypothetical protein [Thalassovita sp.]MDF1803207.1 hypothetical protein [Thalassovita sp.]
MEQHIITWRGVEIEITYTPEKFGMVDHIELRTENKTPLPVTETGYRSHFMNKGAVAHNGGAVPLVTAWLDHEAKRSGWNNAQLSLF